MKVILKNGEECQELADAYSDLGLLLMRGLDPSTGDAVWPELAEFTGASLSYDNSGAPIFDHGNVSYEMSQALRTGRVKSVLLLGI